MIWKVIAEGFCLGVLLCLVCAIGIRNGAIGMVHLYSQEVQQRCISLGMTTQKKIKQYWTPGTISCARCHFAGEGVILPRRSSLIYRVIVHTFSLWFCAYCWKCYLKFHQFM